MKRIKFTGIIITFILSNLLIINCKSGPSLTNLIPSTVENVSYFTLGPATNIDMINGISCNAYMGFEGMSKLLHGNWYSVPAGIHLLRINYIQGSHVTNTGIVRHEFVAGCFYDIRAVPVYGYQDTTANILDVSEIMDTELRNRIILNYNTQTIQSDSDFRIMVIKNGTEIRITGYKGKRNDIQIPQYINNLPVTEIGAEAFHEKNLFNVVIPDTVKVIGRSAFYGNNLKNIIIPNGIQIIPNHTFANNNLTSITIPNSVTSIGWVAFYGNPIIEITIGKSVILGAIQYPSFPNSFDEFYNREGKKEGKYLYINREWIYSIGDATVTGTTFP